LAQRSYKADSLAENRIGRIPYLTEKLYRYNKAQKTVTLTLHDPYD